MNSSRFFISLFMAGFATSALAGGGQEGHGGSVVACFKSAAIAQQVEDRILRNRQGARVDPLGGGAMEALESVELLDLYLARRKAGGRLIPVQAGWKETLEERIATLSRVHHSFYERLTRARSELELGDWFPSESGIVEIDDSVSPLTFNDRCRLLQLALQQEFAGRFQVYYDRRLFDRLKTPLDQAALVLHEWIYNIFIRDLKATDSRGVQVLVGRLFQSLEGKDAIEVHQLLLSLGFRYPEIRIWSFEGSPLMTRWDGKLLHDFSYPADEGLGEMAAGERLEVETRYYRGYDGSHGVGNLLWLSSYDSLSVFDKSNGEFIRKPVFDFLTSRARPKTYLGMKFKEFWFIRGEKYPRIGRLVEPLFDLPGVKASERYPGTMWIEFNSDGSVKLIGYRLTGEAAVDGLSLPHAALVNLDAQKRIVAFNTDLARESVEIPAQGLICSAARFTYEGGARRVLECGMGRSGDSVSYQGLNFEEDSYLKFKTNGDLDLPKMGKFSLRFPRSGTAIQGLSPQSMEYSIRADGTIQVMSFQGARASFRGGSFCDEFRRTFLYDDGALKECTANPLFFDCNRAYQGLPIFPRHRIEFYPDGKVKSFAIDLSSQEKKKFRGVRVRHGDRIELSQGGAVLRVVRGNR